MDGNGELAFEICSKANCWNFTVIDYPYDQFERGLMEGFQSDQLQDCELFEVYDAELSLKLNHIGTDGWRGEYVRLLMDSGLYYHCPINVWLDNEEHVYLECTTGQ